MRLFVPMFQKRQIVYICGAQFYRLHIKIKTFACRLNQQMIYLKRGGKTRAAHFFLFRKSPIIMLALKSFNVFLRKKQLIILPNSIIGVFGSGQLGRMFAIEARKMGYRVHTFSPDTDTPTGQVADLETSAHYEDLDEVKKFAQSVDVITFEFENVPSRTVEIAAEFAEVYPKGEILHTTQNRLREKTFLYENGFPVAPFRHIKILDDLYRATAEIGTPAVLKTAGFGYDGKGQTKINAVGDIEAAFENLRGNEAILEAFVEFGKEVS